MLAKFTKLQSEMLGKHLGCVDQCLQSHFVAWPRLERQVVLVIPMDQVLHSGAGWSDKGSPPARPARNGHGVAVLRRKFPLPISLCPPPESYLKASQCAISSRATAARRPAAYFFGGLAGFGGSWGGIGFSTCVGSLGAAGDGAGFGPLGGSGLVLGGCMATAFGGSVVFTGAAPLARILASACWRCRPASRDCVTALRASACCSLGMVSTLRTWLSTFLPLASFGFNGARLVTVVLWIFVSGARTLAFWSWLMLILLLTLTFSVLFFVMLLTTVFCWTRVRGGRGMAAAVPGLAWRTLHGPARAPALRRLRAAPVRLPK